MFTTNKLLLSLTKVATYIAVVLEGKDPEFSLGGDILFMVFVICMLLLPAGYIVLVRNVLFKDAAVIRSNMLLAKHQEKRVEWNKAGESVREEARSMELRLLGEYNKAIRQAKRKYKEGMDECAKTKQQELAKALNQHAPDATELAIGIAKMSTALRKLKDGSSTKKELEAELSLWQDSYDRVTEAGEKSKA